MRSHSVAALGALALVATLVVPAQAATVSAPGPLAVSISGADSATLGTAYPVTVVVTNTTPDATGAFGSVNFALPLGVQLQGGITTSSGTCTRIGGSGALVICQLASLAPGANATIKFSVQPQVLGALTVGVDAVDGVSIANAVLSVPVNPAPTDVQVTGSASTGSPPIGSDFSYTFQVKDNGPWPAPGVTFADTVPSELGLIGVTSSLGTCSAVGSTVSCDFGDMAVGSQANVFITVSAPAVAETIVNTGSVALANTATDRQPANNSVSVTVQTK